MPPIKKYTKEDIIMQAYEIVKSEGFEQVNARRIAKKLGCSVQPLFHNFTSMEEVNKEVYKKYIIHIKSICYMEEIRRKLIKKWDFLI